MEFEDYEGFEDDLFEKEDPPTEELNDDDVLNKVINKTEARLVQPKKIVNRKPRPNLTEHILTGPKGLCSLRQSFENWHPHKDKSPYENLNEMMEKVEYWGHILQPQLNFDDLLSKIEHVGKKRAVKVYMTKLRLGMPLFEDEGDKEVDDDNRLRSESPQKELSPLPDDDDDAFNDAAWDKLFDDSTAPQEQNPTEKNMHSLEVSNNVDADSQRVSQKKKRIAVEDSDEDSDNDSAPTSQHKSEVAAAKSSQTIQKNKRIVFEDSDDESNNDSANVPHHRKILVDDSDEDSMVNSTPASQTKKLIIADDSDSEIETDVAPTSQKKKRISEDSDEEIVSDRASQKKKRIVEDSDEEVDADSPREPQKKKRRIFDDPDDDVEAPAEKENEEITENSALDYIFD